MTSKRLSFFALLFLLPGALPLRATAPEPGTRLRYIAISTKTEAAPPFAAVDFIYGPEEKAGKATQRWWQLEIRTNTDQATIPACRIRVLTSGDPLARKRAPIEFIRYQLEIPATAETLEYREIHSGKALLPPWLDFEKYFIPAPAAVTRWQTNAPETCNFLGQVLSLQKVMRDAAWQEWTNIKRLDLDREVLVGTGRNFKDAEGRRVPQSPQPKDYTYVNFKAEDYQPMFAAGMNMFMVDATQEAWVRSEPVFYIRIVSGPAPRFPADFYRANYLGGAMFMDEPASILTWDSQAVGKVKHFSDAIAVIEKRSRVDFDLQPYGRYWLESYLTGGGLNLGDMRLGQTENPTWETMYDRTFYMMKTGGTGIVHEGRYDLDAFNRSLALSHPKRAYTTNEMLRYHYAFLRGGSRPFQKFWGTAIYGQCVPTIAPEALTLAYDMGARYFWFWTSDHGHHVPWPEQLELARKLKDHTQQHPRPSIYRTPPRLDAVITIPNGYFLAIDHLGWLHSLDDKNGEPAKAYRRLQERAFREVDECLKRGEDFDITIDDGHPLTGYKRIVKVTADPAPNLKSR